MLNTRMIFGVTLLTILAITSAWAFDWAANSRSVSVYEIKSPVTILQAVESDLELSQSDREQSQKELLSWLEDKRLTWISSSTGDAFPGLYVQDPDGLLDWFSSNPQLDQQSNCGYVFAGTYSATKFAELKKSPLIPISVNICGAIDPPPDIGDTQFVAPLGSVPIPTGLVILSSTDSQEITQVISMLNRMGLDAHINSSSVGTSDILKDPLVSMTWLLFLAGYGCLTAMMTINYRSQLNRFRLLWSLGAPRLLVVAKEAATQICGLVIGIVAGVILANVAEIWFGNEMIPLRYIETSLPAAAGLSVLLLLTTVGILLIQSRLWKELANA